MAKTAKNLEKRIERLDKVDQPRKETWVRMESKVVLDTDLHRLSRKYAEEYYTLDREKQINLVREYVKEVEQAENVRSCIDKLLQEKRGLTQVKKQELGL
ncbi:hypothetical protein RMQ61_08060 [Streptococcus suis]|uniref:hypothetical protein n=1 Tax=Streptococcus suis TaxID=1307 RepID=UPI0028C38EA9|nr:hypothetical protein [Streptococcus suis]WNO77840.1 hypothetical protein RMP67_08340 [Streptococcus suis]WNO82009.1 hypothetical protein RMQ61_08060 [Streptococcus suis]